MDTKKSNQQVILEKIPFFGLSIVISIIAFIAGKSGGGITNLPFKYRISNSILSYGLYIWKMFWPHNLAAFYPHKVNALPLWEVVRAGLFLAIVTVLIIRFMRCFPWCAVGWFWYLGTLLPVIGIVQVGAQAMADRFTYMPLIGLFIIISWGVPEVMKGWRHRRIVLAISTGVLLLAISVTSWFQASCWRDSIKLFNHTLDITSNNVLAHTYLGLYLADKGKLDEAVSHFNEALRINPRYAKAHNNLATVHLRQGKFDEAAVHFSEVLNLNADHAKAFYNLAIVSERQGKLDEAAENYNEALRINPRYARAYNNLAIVLVRQGKLDEAVVHYKEALGIDPRYAKAYNNLAIVFLQQGKLENAARYFTEALHINPELKEARNNLAITLQRLHSKEKNQSGEE